MLRLLCYLWPLPVTLVGVAVALLARASGGEMRVVEGVLEAAGGWPSCLLRRGFPLSGPVAAITLGHVVLGVSVEGLTATRSHEREHVRQFERWGVLLLFLYPAASLLAWARGGHPYRDNAFECAARAAARKNGG
ncbi:conserved hypothetical protein [Thiobacillus denitrificans ATCC 25259]|uniref:Signal peptide prediction n=1 Tax=Thiobacillus denitrificans (strain ATCC 25259 / T1) TaxID=292415 RepID=Q3SI11_THIDA|nr:hypothetical protein [Thiobacillus denitrificans]AAZ97722.1 conserved hypothetical protein [Thiobacillus denitrificans ATCC 25259]